MERRRAWLIEADLAALGDPVSPVASRPAEPGPAESRLTEPRPAEPGLVERAPLPRLDTAARALGCLYVTEGSTLGGQQLARALDGILPPGPTGRRFLLGHGARHGAMWRGCCAALERCGADPAERAAMLDAAAETFAAFEAWFAPAAGAAKRGVALPPRPE
jgi:heme oxygenase